MTNENDNEIEQFAVELDNFIKDHFGYKSKSTDIMLGRGGAISVKRKKVDLHIRYKPQNREIWPADTIVLARIGFFEQRRGHGTALLKFLMSLSDKYSFKQIEVESTHSGANIQNFVRKFGFEGTPDNAHWKCSVENLKATLKCQENY